MCKRTTDLVVRRRSEAYHQTSRVLAFVCDRSACKVPPFIFLSGRQPSAVRQPAFSSLGFIWILDPFQVHVTLYFEIFFFFTFFHQRRPRLLPRGTGVHTQRDTYVPWRRLASRARPKYVAFAALHRGGVWLAYLCSPQWHALVFRPYIFWPIWLHTGLMWLPVSLCPLNFGYIAAKN